MNEPMGHAIPKALWRRHKDDKPVAIGLCDAAHPGTTGVKAGTVWWTDEGHLLHAPYVVPAEHQRIVRGEGVTEDDVAVLLKDRAAWKPGSDVALKKPFVSKGTVVIVDRDDYWIPSLRVTCKKHGPLVTDRAKILDGARRGASTGKTVTVMLPPES